MSGDEADLENRTTESTTAAEWWRSAVVYQIYPRSFADGNGDGIGDFPGMLEHLDHLVALGVDAVWLSPFYVSPQNDAGYDVADYVDVDPLFGSLDDFDRYVAAAHAVGIRVIVDIVANHSSDQHPWFQQALLDGPGSTARARYLFRPGRGADGELPPNNWRSVFGGIGWERVPDGEWYLHLFDPSQPDFDWSNPDVAEAFDEVLRFWLRRGVDGFRVDVAHSFAKEAGLPDADYVANPIGSGSDRGPMWDQPAVHDVYRRWHRVLEEFDGDRALVAEAWVAPAERMALYVRPDEMQQAFNFPFMRAGWSAPVLREVIDASLAANAAVGATTTWVLSNHDVVRHNSRLGLADPTTFPMGIGPDDAQPDAELGLRRGTALTMLSLGLPGSAYVYQGEELGLPEHTELPAEARQDPNFFRGDGTDVGRDGCRVPLPWRADEPGFGFGGGENGWLPQPAVFAELATDRQNADPNSTLNFYRNLVSLRREERLGTGRVDWIASSATVLELRNRGVRIVVNFDSEPLPIEHGEVLLASRSDAIRNGALAPDSAVWLRA